MATVTVHMAMYTVTYPSSSICLEQLQTDWWPRVHCFNFRCSAVVLFSAGSIQPSFPSPNSDIGNKARKWKFWRLSNSCLCSSEPLSCIPLFTHVSTVTRPCCTNLATQTCANISLKSTKDILKGNCECEKQNPPVTLRSLTYPCKVVAIHAWLECVVIGLHRFNFDSDTIMRRRIMNNRIRYTMLFVYM